MEVQGLQDLLKKMEDLPLTMGKTLIVRALRAGAEPIRERAQELAPFLTGKLRESMMTQVSDQTATGATAKIGPSRKGFYGTFEEFGTAHQSAAPWLRPAYDEKQDDALRIIGETLAEGIEREMKKR